MAARVPSVWAAVLNYPSHCLQEGRTVVPEPLDDECWNALVAEALEAYRQETPVRQITARYGLKEEQILALVDESGYARHEEMAQARRMKAILHVNALDCS